MLTREPEVTEKRKHNFMRSFKHNRLLSWPLTALKKQLTLATTTSFEWLHKHILIIFRSSFFFREKKERNTTVAPFQQNMLGMINYKIIVGQVG